MKFSAHIDALYNELPFAERFEAAKNDGFDYVEIWDWDNKDEAVLKVKLKEFGLTLSAMSGDKQYDMCNPAHYDVYVAEVKESIDKAVELGCLNVVIHSNELTPAGPVSNSYPELSEAAKLCAMFRCLKALAPYAEEKKVTLVVEPLNIVTDHMGNFLTSMKQAADLIDAVGSPNVKVLYDIYHMYLNEGKIAETWDKFLPEVGYVHFADAPGRHEPGTGVINYAAVFAHMRKIGYPGIIGCELFSTTNTADAIAAIKIAAVTL